MIKISLPAYLSHELIELIPAQRAHIDKLLQENTVLSYTLAADRSKLWVVLSAKTAQEAEKQYPPSLLPNMCNGRLQSWPFTTR